MAELTDIQIGPDLPETSGDIQISEDSAPSASILSEARVKEKANRINYAFEEDNIGIGLPEIEAMVGQGREAELRELLATNEVIRQDQRIQNQIVELGRQDFARRSGLDQEAFVQSNLTEPAEQIDRLAQERLDLPTTVKPETVIENRIAQSLFDEMALAQDLEHEEEIEDGAISDLEKFWIETEINKPVFQQAKKLLATEEGLKRIAKDHLDEYAQTGWGSFALDMAEYLIPGRSSWLQMGNVRDPDFISSVLPGNNIQEQLDYIRSKEPEEAYALLIKALGEVWDRNPTASAAYAHYVLDFNSTAKALENYVFPGIEIASLIPIQRTAAFLGRIIRGAPAEKGIPGLLEASGAVVQSAFRQALLDFQTLGDLAGGRRKTGQELLRVIPGLANPESLRGPAGATTHLSVGATNNIIDGLRDYGQLLFRGVAESLNVTRIRPGTQAYRTMLTETQDLLFYQYGAQIAKNVMTIEPVRSTENILGNVDYIRVLIGRAGGDVYSSHNNAIQGARRWGLRDYKVVPVNGGFALQVTKTVDETSLSVREALRADVLADPTPGSALRSWAGWLLGKDNLLVKDLAEEAKVVSTGITRLNGIRRAILDREMAGLRGTFKRGKLADLERVLAHHRDKRLFSNTIPEFENHFHSVVGRFPEEKEVKAYFTYRALNDADYMVNNLTEYMKKARAGVEMHDLFKTHPTDLTANIFEGVFRKEIPWERLKDDAGILVLDEKVGTHEYARKNFLPAALNPTRLSREEIDGLLQSGEYRMVQLTSQGKRDFREYLQGRHEAGMGAAAPEGDITYVLTKNLKSSPLPFRQVEYRPGGHEIYKAPFVLAQPIIYRHGLPGGARAFDYSGDRVLMSAYTREEGLRIQDTLRRANAAFRQGTKASRQLAKRIIEDETPMRYRDFVRLTRGRGAVFSREDDFYLRGTNESVAQAHDLAKVYGTNFNDMVRNQNSVFTDNDFFRFTQHRGTRLKTFYNAGTDDAPIWRSELAPVFDPLTTMHMTGSSIMRGKFLDDYKIKAAERFVAEFSAVLKPGRVDWNRFPIQALTEKDLINKAHTDKELVARALNYRRATMELVSMEPRELIDLNRWTERAIRAFGENTVKHGKTGKILEFVAESDPVQFLRYWLGFLPRMGFFHPKQLFLQGQGVLNVAAIEGFGRATKAFGGAMLMRPSMFSTKSSVIQGLASKAEKLGWNRAHYLESYDALQRTGFWQVGSEFVDLGVSGGAITSTARRGADKSLYFFKKGEKAHRLTAWNAAYLHWREANPLAKFDDTAVKWVRNRADMLTMNMTGASQAGWQRGFAAIPTQFWSYQARVMELMWSKRLTPGERAKFLAMTSMMYGVPSGILGTSLGVLYPWHDEFRKELLENNVDVTDTGWKTFIDGVPSMMMGLAEIDHNFSDVFGPSGISTVKDVYRGESFLKIVGGAVGTTLSSSVAQAEPIMYGLARLLHDDDRGYKLTTHDFLPILENISSARTAERTWAAFNTGQYFTKNGIEPINGDYGTWDALFTGILGTVPTKVDDAYLMIEANEERKDWQQRFFDRAKSYIHRSLDENTSMEDRMIYWNRAHGEMAAGSATPEQRLRLMDDALERKEPIIRRLEQELWNGTQEARQRYMNKILDHAKDTDNE